MFSCSHPLNAGIGAGRFPKEIRISGISGLFISKPMELKSEVMRSLVVQPAHTHT